MTLDRWSMCSCSCVCLWVDVELSVSVSSNQRQRHQKPIQIRCNSLVDGFFRSLFSWSVGVEAISPLTFTLLFRRHRCSLDNFLENEFSDSWHESIVRSAFSNETLLLIVAFVAGCVYYGIVSFRCDGYLQVRASATTATKIKRWRWHSWSLDVVGTELGGKNTRGKNEMSTVRSWQLCDTNITMRLSSASDACVCVYDEIDGDAR